MIRSMTGYGKGESVRNGRRYAVEIRSLNHRYLEVSLRFAAAFLPHEIEFRKRIAERVTRGKIEATLRIGDDDCQESAPRFRLNIPLVRNYHAMLVQLRDEFNLQDEITLATLTGFKDVFVPVDAMEDSATGVEGVTQALDEALGLLMEMKRKEGEALCADMADRVEAVKVLLAAISARSPAVVAEYQERLRTRLGELLADAGIDEGRLHQEVAMMAEKSDITEEIVRFQSHLVQFLHLLEGEEPAGRKVDFLVQEMNREINTIGSKSGDREIARCVIDVKAELAKVREQAQNLE
jgi:uncharacterized protein (TIGR00255 family)